MYNVCLAEGGQNLLCCCKQVYGLCALIGRPRHLHQKMNSRAYFSYKKCIDKVLSIVDIYIQIGLIVNLRASLALSASNS